jgi:hypothetical protein
MSILETVSKAQEARARDTLLSHERIVNETSASALTVKQWAEIVAKQLKAERREVLEHVKRLFKLIQIQIKDPHEKMRVDRIAKRLILVEMELQKLRKHLGLSKPS